MKALVYDAPARRVSLGDAPDPAPLPGEVLLTPAYGAICGSDLHMYGGSYGVTDLDLVETLDLLAQDVTRSQALLDRAFPLAEADAAFAHASRSSGKVLLEVAP